MEAETEKETVRKVRRGEIFEAEREFKKAVSLLLSDFRRRTGGVIREIPIQYLDDGSGQFITHIVNIIPDYKNTVIDPSPGYSSARIYDKADYEFEEDGKERGA